MPQHACSLQINTQQAGGGARTSLMTRSGSAQAWASMAAATTARRNVRLGMVCVASSTLPQSRVECRNIYNQRETTESTRGCFLQNCAFGHHRASETVEFRNSHLFVHRSHGSRFRLRVWSRLTDKDTRNFRSHLDTIDCWKDTKNSVPKIQSGPIGSESMRLQMTASLKKCFFRY
jgi:hypothetical protein